MSDPSFLTLSPQIRGLAGALGHRAFVRFDAAGGSTASTLKVSAPDQLEAVWKASSQGGLPSAVHVTGVGTFHLTPAGSSHSANRADVIRGKIAVVTGGAQGFGEEISRGLIANGAFVAVADLNLAGAQKLVDTLNRDAGKAVSMAVAVNISQEDSVAAMVEQIVAAVGGIDVFVANAGVLKAMPLLDQDLKSFEFVTAVNYTGYMLCAKHAARVMREQTKFHPQGWTDIIQINSKSGLEGSNKNGSYAGSKFGGIGLTQSFALELVTHRIKVNSICPGNFFDGPLWSDPDNGLFAQYLRTGKVPGAQTLADVKHFYEAKVPMNRGCTGPDVLRALLYIVEQEYETGQAVPVTGGQVMLN
jgi:sorbitol-6-phosphate 2-dehydrogenase